MTSVGAGGLVPGLDTRPSMTSASATGPRASAERLADRVVPRQLSSHRQEFQYVLIGVWNTLFGYVAWATLNLVLAGVIDYLLIVAVSYPIAVVNAYACYRFIVFRSHVPIFREFPRFSVVYLIILLANVAALPTLLVVLPLNIYVIQGLFTGLVVVVSYIAHRTFSFRRGHVGLSSR